MRATLYNTRWNAQGKIKLSNIPSYILGPNRLGVNQHLAQTGEVPAQVTLELLRGQMRVVQRDIGAELTIERQVDVAAHPIQDDVVHVPDACVQPSQAFDLMDGGLLLADDARLDWLAQRLDVNRYA
jgi:hypothetical protein